MLRRRTGAFAWILLVVLGTVGLRAGAAEWLVTLPEAAGAGTGARLLLLLEPYKGRDKQRLSANSVYPGDMTVAGMNVAGSKAGRTLRFDTIDQVAPQSPDSLTGEYLVQAFLDTDDRYNFDQGGPGDWYSAVQKLTLPLPADAKFTLSERIPNSDLWEFSAQTEQDAIRRNETRRHLHEITLDSRLLSTFHGTTVTMRAWVLLPDDYETRPEQRWPVAYVIGAYSATHKSNIDLASYVRQFGINRESPMIWVFPDFQTAYGPTLFADSANNGPWGTALVDEFIPALETRFRTDARPEGRLLTGHSSGGWSSVWLLVRYPRFFGGAWATAPDSLDFSRFQQVDLYAENANIFHDAAGRPFGLARNADGMVTSTAASSAMERVLGSKGGIFQHWERVYSPRNRDGTPAQLFDRRNGQIDPAVAAYWRENFDLALYLQRNWNVLRDELDGKLHLIVGTADDHYLDASVHSLQQKLSALEADVEFVFLEGKTHNNLFARDSDPLFLLRDIAEAMYRVARPDNE